MLVKKWMRSPVVTVSPEASMYMAREIMNQHDIRALPVMKQNRLVGLLTDRDLKRAEASDATSLDVFELNYLLKTLKVAKIMGPNPVTIEFDATLSEAAESLLKHKLDAAPVMDGKDRLIGILTRSDLERAFLTLTALGRRGIQFGVRFTDASGALLKIIDLIRAAEARLASLITTDGGDGENMREAYFHIYEVDRERLPELVAALNQKSVLLYMVDLKTGQREIFDS